MLKGSLHGVAVVTGSAGLIGSETVRYVHKQGLDVIGVDNNLRAYFFGSDGSVESNRLALESDLPLPSAEYLNTPAGTFASWCMPQPSLPMTGPPENRQRISASTPWEP